MHGRPRKPVGYQEDPEKAALKAKKLEKFKQLTNWVYKKADNQELDEEFLKRSALLLQQNPDVYTIWNLRRQALQHSLEGKDHSLVEKVVNDELQVTENALHENPKSYSAWHHRMWLMRKGLSSLPEELKKVNRFLKLDSRNFVAWHYRRQITRMAGTDSEEELHYSRALIDANFSNYSAWHNRAATLKAQQATDQVISLEDLVAESHSEQRTTLPPERLAEEFDLVQQAFFTDPEDQSAYIYHRWLLIESLAHFRACESKGVDVDSAKQALIETLQREEGLCRELIEVESERSRLKWPLLTLCLLLKLQKAITDRDSTDELQSTYQELARIDPLRAGFYKDAVDLSML